MMKFGFRRNPLTADWRGAPSEVWSSVWQSSVTLVGHSTTRNKALTFDQLVADCKKWHKQEGDPVPSTEEIALDLIKLVDVGLVLVERVE